MKQYYNNIDQYTSIYIHLNPFCTIYTTTTLIYTTKKQNQNFFTKQLYLLHRSAPILPETKSKNRNSYKLPNNNNKNNNIVTQL